MRRQLIALLLTAATLTGCGVEDPYAGKGLTGQDNPPSKPAAKAPPIAAPRPEPLQDARRQASAPERAAAAYATAQGNYTPASYRRQYRAMVALAAGELRRELTRMPLAVIARGIDEAGTSATTAVLATTLETGQGGERVATVAARQVVRTTSEAGRPGPEYVYYRATVRRIGAGWRVVRFEALR